MNGKKKSKNENEHLHNLTSNYQKSNCQWSFATILNLLRSCLTYEITTHFWTSPNEHIVYNNLYTQYIYNNCTQFKYFVIFINLGYLYSQGKKRKIFLSITQSKNFSGRFMDVSDY